MKIQYWGHSSFLLHFEEGTRIVTDPFGDVGIPMPKVSADAVTVSHSHYDHCNVRGVRAPLVLDSEGVFDVRGVHITSIPCDHDGAGGAERGKTLAFRFEAEGLTVLHLGDVGEPCTAEILSRLGKADVLLIPVGGHYTIGAREAKKYVEGIKPSVCIPMHYKVKGLTVDIAGAEEFLSLFAEVSRAQTVTVTEPKGETKIILMERTGDVG